MREECWLWYRDVRCLGFCRSCAVFGLKMKWSAKKEVVSTVETAREMHQLRPNWLSWNHHVPRQFRCQTLRGFHLAGATWTPCLHHRGSRCRTRTMRSEISGVCVCVKIVETWLGLSAERWSLTALVKSCFSMCFDGRETSVLMQAVPDTAPLKLTGVCAQTSSPVVAHPRAFVTLTHTHTWDVHAGSATCYGTWCRNG